MRNTFPTLDWKIQCKFLRRNKIAYEAQNLLIHGWFSYPTFIVFHFYFILFYIIFKNLLNAGGISAENLGRAASLSYIVPTNYDAFDSIFFVQFSVEN